MILSKFLSLVIVLLVGSVHSYCIYNQLADNAILRITQRRSGIAFGRRFIKSLNGGESACCHYSNRDCSPRNSNNEPVVFEVIFHWPRYTSEIFVVHCLSGGGLTLLGSETDYWAECTDPSGSVTRVAVIPDALRS